MRRWLRLGLIILGLAAVDKSAASFFVWERECVPQTRGLEIHCRTQIYNVLRSLPQPAWRNNWTWDHPDWKAVENGSAVNLFSLPLKGIYQAFSKGATTPSCCRAACLYTAQNCGCLTRSRTIRSATLTGLYSSMTSALSAICLFTDVSVSSGNCGKEVLPSCEQYTV
ncbi:hypothetical protein V8C86DRAFT_2700364 [Haematococcus lacustris]